MAKKTDTVVPIKASHKRAVVTRKGGSRVIEPEKAKPEDKDNAQKS